MNIKFICICLSICLSSCLNSSNQQELRGIECSDTVIEKLQANQFSIDQASIIKEEEKIDSIKEQKQFPMPTSIDNYGFTISYYDHYIGLAYDKKTHQKYFATKEQKKLDSLISIYWEATEYYRDYKGTAYPENIFYKYFETKNQYKLDSLIEIYDLSKVKNNTDSIDE